MTRSGGVQAPRLERLPASAVMLFLSVSGMAIGLAIDCGATPPELIAALCTAASGGIGAAFAFHAAMMPAGYAMAAVAAILAAGFSGTARRCGAGRPGTARIVWSAAPAVLMLVGMFAGGWLAPDVAAHIGLAPNFGALVGGMVAGMTAAVFAGAAIANVVRAAIARRTRSSGQYIMYQ
jgi:hypothetical protein